MVEKNTLVYSGAMEYINRTKKSGLKFKKDLTKHTVIARGITQQQYILDCGNDDSKLELTQIVKELINRIEDDEKQTN